MIVIIIMIIIIMIAIFRGRETERASGREREGGRTRNSVLGVVIIWVSED